MNKRLLCIIMLGILLISFSACGSTETVEKQYIHAIWAENYESLQDLTESSDVISIIKVLDVKDTYYRTEAEIPFTEFEVEVITSLKGPDVGETYTVLQTGMESDNFIYEVDSDPLLTIGKEYMIFGYNNELGSVTILGGPQGRFVHENERVSSLVYAEESAVSLMAETTDYPSENAFGLMIHNVAAEEICGEVLGYLK